jgi:hypothetical protein
MPAHKRGSSSRYLPPLQVCLGPMGDAFLDRALVELDDVQMPRT